jgi:hypothetical protein
MFSCASSVEPPTCGVRKTLSRPAAATRTSRRWTRARPGTRRPRRRRGARAECVGERVDVDHGAARRVDEDAPGLHRANCARRSSLRRRRLRHVQRDDVAAASSSSSVAPGARCRARAWSRCRSRAPHAEGLGEHAELGADVAVADDAERLAARLVASPRRDLPTRRDGSLAFFSGMPRSSRIDLGEHQLGDAARVGERRVEDRDARGVGARPGRPGWCRCRSSRSATSFGAAVEHVGGQLRARADADACARRRVAAPAARSGGQRLLVGSVRRCE